MKTGFWLRIRLSAVFCILAVLIPFAAYAADRPSYVSQSVQEVVTMAQAGVGEDVLRTFVETRAAASRMSPEEIVYARDRGVPNSVLTALLNKSASSSFAAPSAPAPALQSVVYQPPVQPVVVAVQPQPSVIYLRHRPIINSPPAYPHYFSYPGYYSHPFDPVHYQRTHYDWHHRPYVGYGVGFHFRAGRCW